MTPTMWLPIIALLAVIAWALHVLTHPYVTCHRCDGTGKRRTQLLHDRFGTCPRCGGEGHHLRATARLWGIGTGRRR